MPKRGRLVGQAEAKAIRAKNKKAFKQYKQFRGQFYSAKIDKSSFDLGFRLLQMFPFEMQKNIVRKCGRAAAIVVREVANTMLDMGSAPHGPDQGKYPGNSMMTGTFDKKSYEQQEARSGRPSMVDKVGIKEKMIRKGYLHMVGPRRPWGNQAWILEWGGVINLWGTGRYYHLRPRPFMGPAGNNTKGIQKRQYLEKMKQEWINW